jgi:hypothetical protein
VTAATPLSRLKDALVPEKDVHSAFLVTYGLDPRFFEAEVIPALVPTKLANDASAGSLSAYVHEADQTAATTPVEVLYDHLTGEGPQLLLGYRQVSLGGAAFHPKLLVAEYDDLLRVIVASANLTRPGWTSLFELFVVEELRRGQPHDWVRGLRSFVAQASEAAGGARPPAKRVLRFLEDVPNGPEMTLHHSFDAALVEVATPAGPVDGIDVVSPFFEGEDGAGLFDALSERYPGAKLRLFLSASQAAEGFVVHGPREKLVALRDAGAELRLIRTNWEGDDERAPNRRALHGKLLGFRAGRRAHVVVGSANATRAALLRDVAGGGNAELVVTLDLDASQYTALLPPSFSTDERLTFEAVDATGEEDAVPAEASRFVTAATYEAASHRLALELRDDAPELGVAYLGRVLGRAGPPGWSTELSSLGVDAYVTVDAGAGPAAVPFVVLDPEALAPRGTPLNLGLEALAELLAGRRELVHPPGDELLSFAPGGVSGGHAALFGRGAIPWRRIIAGLRGLHDDLVRQLATSEAVKWTLDNPLRLRGLVDRFEDAWKTGRFLDGDLAYALHETSATLAQALAAADDAPESAALIAAAQQTIEVRQAELLRTADATIRQQLEVLTSATARA